MSVQAQIDRIAAAKSDIVASIAGKGITVPAGTKIDGLYAYVDAIQTGSGAGGEYNVESVDNGDGTQTINITDATGAVSIVPLTVTENKTYTAPSGTAFNPVTANVPAPTLNLETVELTPSDSIQTRIAAPGFDAIRQVSVLPVPTATYIKRSALSEVYTVQEKPTDGTGKSGDLFIKVVT